MSSSQEDNSGSSPPSPPSSSSPPPPSSSSSPPPPSSSSDSPPPPSQDDNKSPSPPPPSNNSDSPTSKGSSSPPSSNNNSKSTPSPPSPPSNRGTSQNSPTPALPNGSSSPSGSDSSTNEKALIAGVTVGVGLLVIAMIVFFVCCCCKKKKKKPHDQMSYYKDNSHGNKSNYYSNRQHGNWNTAPTGEHAVQIPLPPGSISSEQWPVVPPPPPPPMMSSSEISSTGFSGPRHAPLPPPHPSLALGFNKSTFTYDDLAVATGGFIKANLLGQGGFGYVHKGMLPNGKEIAVKSLKSGSGQGEREFQAEVDIISRVHHRHLVSLVGYCIADAQRMLVYEFVPNNSLEHHLYGKDNQSVMDFEMRLKIALGSAKGFAYLHEDCHPRIIHRDIKAANILLDYNFEAKVADFGLAKLSNDNNTHVSTRIMGTFGYLAPEYASSGKLTEKSDVYSYGVVLLELITGRRPVDVTRDEDDILVDWARPILMHALAEGGSIEKLVDPRLENNYDPHEMMRMVACAAACIRHSARRRPKMSQIVRALEGDVSLDALNEGMKTSNSQVFGSSGSEYDSSHNLDMKRFKRKGVTASQEFTSSEHATTGEFRVPGSNSSSSGESQEIR